MIKGKNIQAVSQVNPDLKSEPRVWGTMVFWNQAKGDATYNLSIDGVVELSFIPNSTTGQLLSIEDGLEHTIEIRVNSSGNFPIMTQEIKVTPFKKRCYIENITIGNPTLDDEMRLEVNWTRNAVIADNGDVNKNVRLGSAMPTYIGGVKSGGKNLNSGEETFQYNESNGTSAFNIEDSTTEVEIELRLSNVPDTDKYISEIRKIKVKPNPRVVPTWDATQAAIGTLEIIFDWDDYTSIDGYLNTDVKRWRLVEPSDFFYASRVSTTLDIESEDGVIDSDNGYYIKLRSNWDPKKYSSDGATTILEKLLYAKSNGFVGAAVGEKGFGDYVTSPSVSH